jgi:hypothetical protein
MEFFIAWIVCIVIGGLIGKYRDRVDSGVIWSALLGPIGWVLVALMEDFRPKCPHCRGVVAEGASKCMHCGGDLVAIAKAVPAPLIAATVPPVAPIPPPPKPIPPPPKPKPAPDSAIPCPLCGKSLWIATLRRGENYCPHCFEKFIAE